ncbi:MAG: ComEC/Rec2 family competence protein, partial [Clostridium sp.]
EEFNDYSPIMKLTFGDMDFIFTGDAEYHAEEDVVAKYPNDLQAEVLKFGHHGSKTSSTRAFVESVKPTYGIISCGLNNDYGHPHRETLDKITKYNIESYRTDKQGQITLSTDGKTISVKTEK